MSPKKRSAAATLQAIIDQAELDEIIADVDRMTDDEVAEDLRAAGFDLEATRAKSRAVREGLAQNIAAAVPAPTPAPTLRLAQDDDAPKAKKRARRGAIGWLPLGAGGALAAAASVAFYVAQTATPIGPIAADRDASHALTPTEAERRAKATALRGDALAACDESRWDACKAGLDEAMALDPEGENDARVVGARAAMADASTLRPPTRRDEKGR